MEEKYDHRIVEEKIRKYWSEKNIYSFKNNGKEIYAIDTPPPTVSGQLHIGHVFSRFFLEFLPNFKFFL